MKLSEIFNELLEARVTINDTANLAVIFIKDDNIFLLIDITTGKPKGYISFGLTQVDESDTWWSAITSTFCN